MPWILADLLMFSCSVSVYIAVRKAALDKLPSQFNNLAMFAIPLIIFLGIDAVVRPKLGMTLRQTAEMLGTGVILSYYGNALCMRSIELAPNPGYSLVLAKSYVVLTSILAVPLFGAQLTWHGGSAIILIVCASALLLVNPKEAHRVKGASWVWLAVGSFFCWAFLSLMSKRFMTQGMPTLTFLTYLFIVVVACILLEMRYRKIKIAIIVRHWRDFSAIGLASTGFNFFNFYAIGIAPNVGYVNATNTASVGVVTLAAVWLFKDELTKQKMLGVSGVIAGMLLLFIWK